MSTHDRPRRRTDETRTVHATTVTLLRVTLTAIAAAALLVFAVPGTARAVTIVSPDQGTALEWMQLRPAVAFDVAQGEKPKWVLLSTNADMSNPIRYCRIFGSVWSEGAWRWGCDAWAIGTDSWGNDIVRPLEWNRVYYFHIAYTDADGASKDTDVRAFRIANAPTYGNGAEVIDKIFGTVLGDGTNLNTGARAWVNSGVRFRSIKSSRVAKNRFRIGVQLEGGADLSRSYIRVKSRAGTRYLPLRSTGSGTAVAVWNRSMAERRIRPQQYRYQGFLKSKKNGAMVRSEHRVVIVRSRRR